MTSRGAESADTTELTFVGLLAAGCIGLASGAALLGVLLAAGDPLLGVSNFFRSLAVGALFLIPLGLIFGAPVVASLRKRGANFGTSVLTILIGGSLVSALLAVVAGLITGSIWTAFLAVIPASVYCLGFALLFGRFFSRRQTLSLVVIVITVFVSLVTGVTSLIVPSL